MPRFALPVIALIEAPDGEQARVMVQQGLAAATSLIKGLLHAHVDFAVDQPEEIEPRKPNADRS